MTMLYMSGNTTTTVKTQQIQTVVLSIRNETSTNEAFSKTWNAGFKSKETDLKSYCRDRPAEIKHWITQACFRKYQPPMRWDIFGSPVPVVEMQGVAAKVPGGNATLMSAEMTNVQLSPASHLTGATYSLAPEKANMLPSRHQLS